MYAKLLRRAIFPALDVLNRTQISKVLAFLERSQWFDASDLAELQRRKLEDLLAWTQKHSEFYRDHWKSAAETRRAASLHPELDGLPIVTKADLKRHASEFPLTGFRGRSLAVSTSGSTGEPMTFYRSALQESWFWALRLRMWGWAGFRLGEPYVTLNLNPRTAVAKRIQDVLFRCSYHGFNANEHDVDRVLEDLARPRLRSLVGYASSLYLLSCALRARGVEGLSIDTLLSTGDTLFPSYRSTIEEVFGVGVVDYYGAGGEGFHVASQCEARDAYHVHGENAIVEILVEGRPARPGELGEIVVTQLDNRAMPLVRYALNDMARVARRSLCGCGRQTPLLEGIEGRIPDIVCAPDGSALVVHFFTILFEHLEGINQFQIVQRRADAIEARIVPAEHYRAAETERAIQEAVSGATQGSLRVDFAYEREIPLSPSGKRRFVVSHVASSRLGATAG